MSNKLSGREAVKALMDGKRVRSSSVVPILGTITIFPDLKGSRFVANATLKTADIYSWELSQIIEHDDWEIVPEPMVWEDEQTVGTQFFSKQLTVSGSLVSSECKEVQVVYVPDSFKEKRVKVRIEEIL